MSIAILISVAFFSRMSVCLFIIVECGVPLAHSTTHDIYNQIERLDGGLPALQSFNDRSSKLGCRGIPAKVKGDVLFAGDCIIAGLLDSAGKIDFAEVPQHHAGTEQEGRRVGFALPCDVRRCAVDALKDRGALTDIAARRDPQPADQARAEIAHNIAVEVRKHHHIEAPRIYDKLHAAVIDDDFLVLQLWILSWQPRGSSSGKARRSFS